MFQMKGQNKTLEELNKTWISNLPNKEFKVVVVKTLTGLQRRVDELIENLNKETENIKKNSELENTTEMKNTLQGIIRRLEDAEE